MVVQVDVDGHMDACPSVCKTANVHAGTLNEAINSVLNLNCDTLRYARQAVGHQLRQTLVDLISRLDEMGVPIADQVHEIDQWVGSRLGPDASGNLNAYWSTQRCALGEIAESWIAANHASIR